MAEKNQESQGLGGSLQPEATGDERSTLLKLAERTIVQAETLAQEITDHAKQESESAGAKIIAEASEKAEAEAQKTIDNAKHRSETLTGEAASEAIAESEKMLTKAQSDSEKLVNKAKENSDRLLSKARTDSEASVGLASNEVQEILAKARQEAPSIISASKTQAASAESKARLQAKFIIGHVSEGTRASVLEICYNLLQTEEDIGKYAPEALNAPEVDSADAIETPMPESADSDEEHSPATNLLPAEEEIGNDAPEALNAPEADSAEAIETPMPESADSDEELIRDMTPLEMDAVVFWSDLNDIAVDARLSDQEPSESIEFAEGPISQIDFVYSCCDRRDPDPHRHDSRIEGLVPDPRLHASFTRLRIRSVLEKSFPVFGRVKSVRWDVKVTESWGSQRDYILAAKIRNYLNRGVVLIGDCEIVTVPGIGWRLGPRHNISWAEWRTCRPEFDLSSTRESYQEVAEALLAMPMPESVVDPEAN